jgi:putative phosphoribosyl transferase
MSHPAVLEALFRNRIEAGQQLARQLGAYRHLDHVVVLGLPRGGVPVAFEIAKWLDAPLDVFVVRKLAVPEHPELAMGAIASGGVRVLNDLLIRVLGVWPAEIEAVALDEKAELERRERSYRGERPPPDLRDRTVILVDDGVATGASMRAALRALQQRRPLRIVVAVPVGAASTCAELRAEADSVVCAHVPPDFAAVGQFYADFAQTTDAEVRELLERAAARLFDGRSARDASARR